MKTYIVPVRSHVSADYTVQANSKAEAHKIVEAEMEASLRRQIASAHPRPEISNIDGWTEALKSQIKIVV